MRAWNWQDVAVHEAAHTAATAKKKKKKKNGHTVVL
jgi:hypothetical protein